MTIDMRLQPLNLRPPTGSFWDAIFRPRPLFGFNINTTGTLRLDSSLTSNDSGNNLGGGDIFIQVGAGNTQFNGGANAITAAQNTGTNVAIFTIQPITVGGDMSVGVESGGVQLSNADIATLGNTFHHILIGRPEGTGTTNINNDVTFKDQIGRASCRERV